MGLINREYAKRAICFAERACLYVHNLFKWSNDNSRNIYCQLLYDVKWRVKTGDPVFMPLHSLWLKNEGAHEDFNQLTKLGLLLNDGNYSHGGGNKGKCLHYTIPESIILEFDRLDKSGGKRVNIFTLKPYKHNRSPAPVQTESTWIESNHKKLYISSLQEAAVKEIMSEPVAVNLAELKWVLMVLEDQLTDGTISKKDREYLPQIRELDYFLSYGYNKAKTGNFQTFVPKFEYCYTGRIIEIIGLQRLLADIRRSLLKNVRCVNYDLKKSQLHVLNFYLIKNGLTEESKTIEGLIGNNGELTSLINDGYPENLLKDVIYNVIFACGFGNELANLPAFKEAVFDLGLDYGRAVSFLKKVADASKKLAGVLLEKALVSLKTKHYLIGDYQDHKLTEDKLESMTTLKYKSYLKSYKKRHARAKANGLSLPRLIDASCIKMAAMKRMVLAMTLQGLESYIIHTITLRGKEYGYRVISNQHDGCIVVGDTDKVQNVMQEINNQLGYTFYLIEKPI